MRHLALLLATLAVVAVLWPAWPAGRPAIARAQGEIDVVSEEVRSQFPEGILFKLDFESEEPVKEVRFRYAVAPDGARAYGVPDCAGVTTVQCTFDLESEVGNFLIPGVEITYFWEIRDHAGNTVETEPGRLMYEDDRFDWETLSEDGLTVWFYAASEEDVRDLLSVGLEAVERMSALLGTELDFPVKVFLYDSVADLEPVLLSRQISPQEGVVTLGEVVVSDTAVVADDAYSWDILRHELSHIVMRKAVEGPFRNLPAWLEEGVAVYGQSEPLPGMESALAAAIDGNRPLSVRSMSSAAVSGTEANVSLFYGQSYSLVRFLIDEYGEAKLRELLTTFREGSRTDDALIEVYGFDQDGLENAWRRSVGLPERQIEEDQVPPTPTPPQITPFGADESPTEEVEATPTPADGDTDVSADDEDEGVPVVVLIVVAAVTLAVAGAFATAAVLVLRRR